MAGDLHEVSTAIGALQASVKSFEESGRARDQKLDTLLDRTSALPDMKRHIDSHCDDLRTLNNYVQRIKGVAWSGRVLWAVVAAICVGGYTLYQDHKAAAEANAKNFGVVWSAINRIAPAK